MDEKTRKVFVIHRLIGKIPCSLPKTESGYQEAMKDVQGMFERDGDGNIVYEVVDYIIFCHEEFGDPIPPATREWLKKDFRIEVQAPSNPRARPRQGEQLQRGLFMTGHCKEGKKA